MKIVNKEGAIRLFVTVNSLDDIDDVNIPTPANEDYMVWDSGTSKWVNKTPTEVMAILSGEAAADFSLGDQNLTNVGEITLVPKASSSGAEGTIFYDSDDDHVYVGTE
jgi:hypothetical protein